jgi:hypothetical protein
MNGVICAGFRIKNSNRVAGVETGAFSPCLFMAHCGGSRQCGMMPAVEVEADGRETWLGTAAPDPWRSLARVPKADSLAACVTGTISRKMVICPGFTLGLPGNPWRE